MFSTALGGFLGNPQKHAVKTLGSLLHEEPNSVLIVSFAYSRSTYVQFDVN